MGAEACQTDQYYPEPNVYAWPNPAIDGKCKGDRRVNQTHIDQDSQWGIYRGQLFCYYIRDRIGDCCPEHDESSGMCGFKSWAGDQQYAGEAKSNSGNTFPCQAFLKE